MKTLTGKLPQLLKAKAFVMHLTNDADKEYAREILKNKPPCVIKPITNRDSLRFQIIEKKTGFVIREFDQLVPAQDFCDNFDLPCEIKK